MPLYAHFSACDQVWPWPDFTPAEVACKCCGELFYDSAAMDALQDLRNAWGRPIIVNSAHRCTKHNRDVGGVENSQHLKIAFDCRCPGRDQGAFIAAARAAGFRGIGRYPSRGFVHLDLIPRKNDEWRG